MYYPNHEEFYKVWDARKQKFVFKGAKDELVKHIAAMFVNRSYEITAYGKKNLWFRVYFNQYSNSFIEECACSSNDAGEKYYQIFDNFGRIINVADLANDSFTIYQKWKETWTFPSYIHSDYWLRDKKVSKKYYYGRASRHFKYRQEPVPYTRKAWRGGSFGRAPHTKHIFLMYDNPEYKEFNRGSSCMVPSYWDDRIRCPQRSWKEQSKARHQWQRGNK